MVLAGEDAVEVTHVDPIQVGDVEEVEGFAEIEGGEEAAEAAAAVVKAIVEVDGGDVCTLQLSWLRS